MESVTSKQLLYNLICIERSWEKKKTFIESVSLSSPIRQIAKAAINKSISLRTHSPLSHFTLRQFLLGPSGRGQALLAPESVHRQQEYCKKSRLTCCWVFRLITHYSAHTCWALRTLNPRPQALTFMRKREGTWTRKLHAQLFRFPNMRSSTPLIYIVLVSVQVV